MYDLISQVLIGILGLAFICCGLFSLVAGVAVKSNWTVAVLPLAMGAVFILAGIAILFSTIGAH